MKLLRKQYKNIPGKAKRDDIVTALFVENFKRYCRKSSAIEDPEMVMNTISYVKVKHYPK